MIQINEKYNCCGCESCVQICPKGSIKMQRDHEGFFYPRVDDSTCINCHLCEKVCPILNKRIPIEPLEIWAAQNRDEKVRRASSSGGVFSLLAEHIINDHGVVFGAKFNDQWEVVHDFSEKKEDLIAFRGSKYVQSKILDNFVLARKFLEEGKKVLFIGTPCQISGLKFYLRKEYVNLFTVDFICHGVPSPGVFRWYLHDQILKLTNRYDTQASIQFSKKIKLSNKIENYGLKNIIIEEIRFRDKREGWKKYNFFLQFIEKQIDGTKKHISFSSRVTENLFLKGFCRDLYLRPSCHHCPARGFKSGSDITLADFWGQEYMFPEFDDDSGVSCVMIKTSKGKKIFDALEQVKKERKTLEQVLSYNPSLIKSTPESYYRKKFWKCVGKCSFDESIVKSINLNIIEKIVLKIKSVLE